MLMRQGLVIKESNASRRKHTEQILQIDLSDVLPMEETLKILEMSAVTDR